MSTRAAATVEPVPEKEDDRVIKSVGFSKEQWAHVEQYADANKIKHSTFIRNAVLAQVGAPTDAKDLLEAARAVDKAVRPPPALAAVPPPKPVSTKQLRQGVKKR